MFIKGIEIKPGYIIRKLAANGLRTIDYIVVPVSTNVSKYRMIVLNSTESNWEPIEEFQYEDDIIAIYGLMTDKWMLNSGELLWEKPKIVTVTKQEIADKFGIDVNLLKIE